jgi:hypothetical protein
VLQCMNWLWSCSDVIVAVTPNSVSHGITSTEGEHSHHPERLVANEMMCKNMRVAVGKDQVAYGLLGTKRTLYSSTTSQI